jgi:TolB-like protein
MRKTYITALLLIFCGIAAFAQAKKPQLAILPFAGGSESDGEAIASRFSIQRDIMNAFTVVPRTGAVNALLNEQNFQMSGYTDSDTIASLGKMLNADFVVSGHIRHLGDRNLIITTLVNVETFELLAGDYREYRNIEEIPALLPTISRIIINASKRNTSGLPTLAIAPFRVSSTGNVNAQEAETLAQILSVEITNNGGFAVLPRTATMQAALKELNFQMSGYTTEEEAARLGAAINAQYVLSAEVQRLGSLNMFTAMILNVESGQLIEGNSQEYRTVTDGIYLMPEIAKFLTDHAGTIKKRQDEERRAHAKLWSIGVSAGSSFADPWVIATVRGTIAPFPYSFLEIGLDAGFISKFEGAAYWSLYPFAHYAFFLPFTEKLGWYVGAGGGFMIENYRVEEWTQSGKYWAVDLTTGFNLWNMLNVSYTMRTNFTSANHKASVGFTYRFR